MKRRNFEINAKLWRWSIKGVQDRPGDGGWYFVNLDKGMSAEIRKKYTKGMVKIEAQIGKTKWNTSLFPHRKPVSYLLCIKKKVREAEDLLEGDILEIKIKIL